MRIVSLACLVAFAAARPLCAQSLDIGGIELRIGQPTEAVISQLRVAYILTYQDEVKRWLVSQQEGSLQVSLGQFDSRDGVVTFIAKDYHVRQPSDLAHIYTTGMRETQRRGGSACTTVPLAWSDNVFLTIETNCGRYKLSLGLPFTVGDAQYSASVQLTVK